MNTDPQQDRDATGAFGDELVAWLFGASQVALAVGTGLAVLVG